MDEKEPGGKVRVVDRRWFNADGELRDADAPAAPAPYAPSPAEPEDEVVAGGGPVATPEDTPPAESPAGWTQETGRLHGTGQPGFVELVDSLAQPAVAFLSGQVPGRGRDLGAARYYIDLLGVLERTTRGNLSLEEKSVLDDVLYQLRSLFVAASR